MKRFAKILCQKLHLGCLKGLGNPYEWDFAVYS